MTVLEDRVRRDDRAEAEESVRTPMLNQRWVSWLANGLSAVVLVLAMVLVFSSMQVRALQDKVSAGRADLAKLQTLAGLDNSLVQLLAKTAAEKNDGALQALLARNGITFHVEPDAAGSHASSPAGPQ
jgi:hypothetical protein